MNEKIVRVEHENVRSPEETIIWLTNELMDLGFENTEILEALRVFADMQAIANEAKFVAMEVGRFD